MSRPLAIAIMESIDHMDPTNSREVKPSARRRHSGSSWHAVAAWTAVVILAFIVLALLGR